RGQVLVDGVDIRRYAQRDLRRHIGLVLQDVFLFSGTVASNIRLGNREISDDEIRRAARFVNAHRFIEELPDRYATSVVERGSSRRGHTVSCWPAAASTPSCTSCSIVIRNWTRQRPWARIGPPTQGASDGGG